MSQSPSYSNRLYVEPYDAAAAERLQRVSMPAVPSNPGKGQRNKGERNKGERKKTFSFNPTPTEGQSQSPARHLQYTLLKSMQSEFGSTALEQKWPVRRTWGFVFGVSCAFWVLIGLLVSALMS